MSSQSQSQSTLAAKRKSNTRADKDNALKKRRDKLDTKDDAQYNVVKKRRGKLNTKDDAKYDNKDNVIPLTDAPFREKQWE